jgi:glycine cleavage system H protein
MNVPDDLRYNASHEWVRLEGDIATVGITDHAQEELTDVVFVELPPLGKSVDAGDPIAVVESVKAASDIYAPVSGEVVEANDGVEGDPALVNTDPYGSGWIFKLKVKDLAQVEAMLDAAGYRSLIGG